MVGASTSNIASAIAIVLLLLLLLLPLLLPLDLLLLMLMLLDVPLLLRFSSHCLSARFEEISQTLQV